MSDQERLASLRKYKAGINKKYGDRTMQMGVHAMDIPRIPSGSMALDYCLGGGYPIQRTIGLWGDESSGKTTAALRAAGIAQKLCSNCYRFAKIDRIVDDVDPETGEVTSRAEGFCDCVQSGLYVPEIHHQEKLADFNARKEALEDNSFQEFRVAFIDVEGTLDAKWATKVGVDVNRIVYSAPETAEEALDIYATLLRTGSVDLFILDSIAALTPSAEVEESFEKWQQGLQARLVNKFTRASQAGTNAMARAFGTRTTHIWINQWREKIGVLFGDNRTAPGGKGQRFAYSVIVEMWAKGYETEAEEGLKKEDATELGTQARFCFKVRKNKTAPPKGAGSYLMHLAGDRAGQVDETDYILQLAERFGQIRKEGSKWFLGVREFKTKTAAVDYMMTDPREFERVRQFLLKAMLK